MGYFKTFPLVVHVFHETTFKRPFRRSSSVQFRTGSRSKLIRSSRVRQNIPRMASSKRFFP